MTFFIPITKHTPDFLGHVPSVGLTQARRPWGSPLRLGAPPSGAPCQTPCPPLLCTDVRAVAAGRGLASAAAPPMPRAHSGDRASLAGHFPGPPVADPLCHATVSPEAGSAGLPGWQSKEGAGRQDVSRGRLAARELPPPPVLSPHPQC